MPVQLGDVSFLVGAKANVAEFKELINQLENVRNSFVKVRNEFNNSSKAFTSFRSELIRVKTLTEFKRKLDAVSTSHMRFSSQLQKTSSHDRFRKQIQSSSRELEKLQILRNKFATGQATNNNSTNKEGAPSVNQNSITNEALLKMKENLRGLPQEFQKTSRAIRNLNIELNKTRSVTTYTNRLRKLQTQHRSLNNQFGNSTGLTKFKQALISAGTASTTFRTKVNRNLASAKSRTKTTFQQNANNIKKGTQALRDYNNEVAKIRGGKVLSAGIGGSTRGIKKASKAVSDHSEILRDLSAVAVLGAGPLSGLGARIIALGGIADRSGVGIATLAVGLGAALFTVEALRRNFIKLISESNALEKRFLAVTGTTIETNSELEYLRDLAEKTGVDFIGLANSYSKITFATRAAGLQSQASRKHFEDLTFAFANMGLTAEGTSRALRAIEQILSKGTVQSEEIVGQLGDVLPGVLQIAANAFGKSVSEFRKDLEDGKVDSVEFFKVFSGAIRESFGAGNLERIDTFGGSLRRLNNSLRELSLAFANSSGITNLFIYGTQGITDSLIFLNRHINRISFALNTFIATAGVLTAFGLGVKIIAIGKAFLTASISVGVLNAALITLSKNPYLVVVTASLALATYAFTIFGFTGETSLGKLNRKIRETDKLIQELSTRSSNSRITIGKIDQVEKEIKSFTNAINEAEEAKRKLGFVPLNPLSNPFGNISKSQEYNKTIQAGQDKVRGLRTELDKLKISFRQQRTEDVTNAYRELYVEIDKIRERNRTLTEGTSKYTKELTKLKKEYDAYKASTLKKVDAGLISAEEGQRIVDFFKVLQGIGTELKIGNVIDNIRIKIRDLKSETNAAGESPFQLRLAKIEIADDRLIRNFEQQIKDLGGNVDEYKDIIDDLRAIQEARRNALSNRNEDKIAEKRNKLNLSYVEELRLLKARQYALAYNDKEGLRRFKFDEASSKRLLQLKRDDIITTRKQIAEYVDYRDSVYKLTLAERQLASDRIQSDTISPLLSRANELNKAIPDLNAYTEAQKRLNFETTQRRRLEADDTLSQEQRVQRLEQLTNAYDALTNAQKNNNARLQYQNNVIEGVKTSFQSLNDEFANSVVEGKINAENFANIFRNLAKVIIAETIKIAITRTLLNATFGSFGVPAPPFADGVVNYQGKGSSRSDSNVVRISRGESVITADATSKYGGFLEDINDGIEPRIKSYGGGRIGGRGRSNDSGGTIVNNIVFNITQKDNESGEDLAQRIIATQKAYEGSQQKKVVETIRKHDKSNPMGKLKLGS